MISPRLSKVVSGTRLTTDLLNSMIKRTEYAADLLQQHKLIAGNEMYVEPHYDGTRVSYVSPVGGGVNPVVPVVPLEYNYRVIQNTPSLDLVVGGPSSINTAVQLQRYTGTGGVGDPIVPQSWVTPIDYKARFFVDLSSFIVQASADVTGEFVNINYVFDELASSTRGSRQVLVYLANEKGQLVGGSSLDGSVFYPYDPKITITSSSIPVGLGSRLSFSCNIGPLVDFSPVQVSVQMFYKNVGGPTEFFNISATSIFSSGSFESARTFDTDGGSSVVALISTYFKDTTLSVFPS